MGEPPSQREPRETVSVAVTVLRLDRVAAGGLLALAAVEIDIAGVVLTLHGVRVIRTGPRSRGVAAPFCRVAKGRLAEAISLPADVTRAIGEVVLDEYEGLVATAVEGIRGRRRVRSAP